MLAVDSVQAMTDQHLFVQIYSGGTDIGAHFNGSGNLAKTTVLASGTANASGGAEQEFAIGRAGGYNGNNMSGLVQELIAYPNDQNANRSGLESNVNGYFNIYP